MLRHAKLLQTVEAVLFQRATHLIDEVDIVRPTDLLVEPVKTDGESSVCESDRTKMKDTRVPRL